MTPKAKRETRALLASGRVVAFAVPSVGQIIELRSKTTVPNDADEAQRRFIMGRAAMRLLLRGISAEPAEFVFVDGFDPEAARDGDAERARWAAVDVKKTCEMARLVVVSDLTWDGDGELLSAMRDADMGAPLAHDWLELHEIAFLVAAGVSVLTGPKAPPAMTRSWRLSGDTEPR